MIITWQRVVLFVILVVVAVWAYFHFFASAGKTATEDLPAAYAAGNPIALRALEKRDYDKTLSPAFRKMATEAEEPKAREAALVYLARGTETAEEGVIVSALKDTDAKVREAACDAARRRHLRQAVEVIIPLLDDEEVAVQGAAQAALQEITGIRKYMGRSEWEQRWSLSKDE